MAIYPRKFTPEEVARLTRNLAIQKRDRKRRKDAEYRKKRYKIEREGPNKDEFILKAKLYGRRYHDKTHPEAVAKRTKPVLPRENFMYDRLKDLLLEGVTTGGDPYVTGNRLGTAKALGRIKTRKSRDEHASLLNVVQKMTARRLGFKKLKNSPGVERLEPNFRKKPWHTDKDYVRHRKLMSTIEKDDAESTPVRFLRGLKTGARQRPDED